VFWLLVTVSALMLVVGVPVLHAQSKATLNRAYIQQIRDLRALVENGSIELSAATSSDEVQRRLHAPVMDETYGQFLWSAAVLAIGSGLILAIAFYVRYQITATDEAASG
jgi:heme exporter protein D